VLGVEAAGQCSAGQGGDALERGEHAVGGREATLRNQVGHERLDRGVPDTGDGPHSRTPATTTVSVSAGASAGTAMMVAGASAGTAMMVAGSVYGTAAPHRS
jgi:hypothetical protein